MALSTKSAFRMNVEDWLKRHDVQRHTTFNARQLAHDRVVEV
jgi:hypothetical protein